MPSSAKLKLTTKRSKTSQGIRGSSSASSLFADTNAPQSWKESDLVNNSSNYVDSSQIYIKPNTTTGGSRQSRQSRDIERGSFVPTNLMLDSNTKSLEWFKSYQKRLNDRELFKLSKAQHQKIKSINEKLAKQQADDLAIFEASLKSKSMRV